MCDTFMMLKHSENWHLPIHHNKEDFFYSDYIHNPWAYQDKPSSLLDFHVNTLKHHKQKNPGHSDESVLIQLHIHFPDFVPEIFYEYVTEFSRISGRWGATSDVLLKTDPGGIN